MLFPIYLKGQVKIDKAPGSKLTRQTLSQCIADTLRKEEAKSVDVNPKGISFEKDGWARPIWNRRLLSCVSSGAIDFATDDNAILVNYKINISGLMAITSVLIGVLIALNLRDVLQTPSFLISYGVAWTIVVGGNGLTSFLRFKKFIRSCAREADKQA